MIEKLEGVLTRLAYLPWGTFGELRIGDIRLYTVECPWLNNKRFESCIPEGRYSIIKHRSPKHGNCFALLGEGVVLNGNSAKPTDRYACLFHVANFPDNVQGCIGPGTAINPIPVNGRQWPKSMGVSASGPSMNRLLSVLPDLWYLTITHKSAIVV